VRVISGGLYRDQPIGVMVLLDSADSGILAALGEALSVEPDPATFGHCACLGNPTLELFCGETRLAVIGLHHGESLRWPRWKHDARLVRPEALTSWLIAHAGSAGGEPGTGGPFSEEAQLLRLDPSDRLAYRAHSYRVRGDGERALRECEEALHLRPESPLALAIRGSLYADAARYAEAEIDLNQAIDHGFEEAEAYRMRAIVREALDKCEEALGDCDTLIRMAPEVGAAHHTRGILLNRLGRADDALAAFSEAIRLAPDRPLPYWTRAMLALNTGQPQRGVDDLTHLIAILDQGPQVELLPAEQRAFRAQKLAGERVLGPDLCGAHLLRGRAYQAMGEIEKALDDFTYASLADSRNLLPIEWRAELNLARGEPQQALEDAESLIHLRPQDPAGYRHRATARILLGEAELVSQDLETLLELRPADAEIRGFCAETLMRLGRPDEALEEIDHAIQHAPDDPRGYFLRSMLWHSVGERDRQRQDLEHVLRLDPDQVVTLNCLAWLLATSPDEELRDGPRSVVLARRAVEQTGSQNPHLLDTLAACLAEVGEFAEARETQRAAIDIFRAHLEPEQLDPYLERLDAYERDQPYREL
jgi:tetratricopeptide (TPR) repeat protein